MKIKFELLLAIVLLGSACTNYRGGRSLERGRLTAQLFLAISSGEVVRSEELLARGADPNGRNDSEDTPLIAAIDVGSEQLVRMFIERRVDLNATNIIATSPLLSAVSIPSFAISKMLIDAGADVNRSVAGVTPFQYACAGPPFDRPLLDIVLDGTLDSKQAEPEARGAIDREKLRAEYKAIVMYMLEHGAKTTLRDFRGVSPLGIAKECGQSNVVSILEKWGAVD